MRFFNQQLLNGDRLLAWSPYRWATMFRAWNLTTYQPKQKPIFILMARWFPMESLLRMVQPRPSVWFFQVSIILAPGAPSAWRSLRGIARWVLTARKKAVPSRPGSTLMCRQTQDSTLRSPRGYASIFALLLIDGPSVFAGNLVLDRDL